MPISELRNYGEVVRSVSVGSPVYLSQDGVDRYVLMDIAEHRQRDAEIKLFSKLAEAEAAIKTGGEWLSPDDVDRRLGLA
jgi:hypothetical protein